MKSVVKTDIFNVIGQYSHVVKSDYAHVGIQSLLVIFKYKLPSELKQNVHDVKGLKGAGFLIELAGNVCIKLDLVSRTRVVFVLSVL